MQGHRGCHTRPGLFAAVGNNSAANEINCAHTDNCKSVAGRELEGLRGGWQRGPAIGPYAMSKKKRKNINAAAANAFLSLIENITHTQRATRQCICAINEYVSHVSSVSCLANLSPVCQPSLFATISCSCIYSCS